MRYSPDGSVGVVGDAIRSGEYLPEVDLENESVRLYLKQHHWDNTAARRGLASAGERGWLSPDVRQSRLLERNSQRSMCTSATRRRMRLLLPIVRTSHFFNAEPGVEYWKTKAQSQRRVLVPQGWESSWRPWSSGLDGQWGFRHASFAGFCWRWCRWL